MGRTFAVIAEMRGNQVRQVTWEALGAVAQMAKVEDRVIVLVIGYAIGKAVDALSLPGIHAIVAADNDRYQYYEAETYFAAARTFADQEQPDIVLLGHTAMGRNWPRCWPAICSPVKSPTLFLSKRMRTVSPSIDRFMPARRSRRSGSPKHRGAGFSPSGPTFSRRAGRRERCFRVRQPCRNAASSPILRLRCALSCGMSPRK